MNFHFTRESLDKTIADLVFVVTFQKDSEKPVAATLQQNDGGQGLDKLLEGQITQAIKAQEFNGKEGESLLIHSLEKIKAKNILIIGAGLQKKFSLETIRRIGGKVAQISNGIKAQSVGCVVEQTKIKGLTTAERLQAFVEGCVLANYSFDYYKDKQKRTPKTFKAIHFQTKGNTALLAKACTTAETFAQAANFTRDLTNSPPNDLTPTALAKAALALAKEHRNISCRVLGLKEIKAQKMGGLLAVTKGSSEPPQFIHLTYKPGQKSRAKVALIGKGITFDSGGLNIKTREIELMKLDMAGAGTALGVFKALATSKPKVHVEGFIASCENMPSGNAVRPGDIITTRAGTTVEVINTDAEGRLVLADALDYACESKPTYMTGMGTSALSKLQKRLFERAGRFEKFWEWIQSLHNLWRPLSRRICKEK